MDKQAPTVGEMRELELRKLTSVPISHYEGRPEIDRDGESDPPVLQIER
jgi:hypothetical protein